MTLFRVIVFSFLSINNYSLRTKSEPDKTLCNQFVLKRRGTNASFFCKKRGNPLFFRPLPESHACLEHDPCPPGARMRIYFLKWAVFTRSRSCLQHAACCAPTVSKSGKGTVHVVTNSCCRATLVSFSRWALSVKPHRQLTSSEGPLVRSEGPSQMKHQTQKADKRVENLSAF